MIEGKNQKVVGVIRPAAIVDNAAFTVEDVDTLGFGHCSIYVMLGATDIAMAALKLQESDDDSTYADVDGADYSTDGTLPADDADNTIVAFHVNIDGTRKRYLRLVATAGNGAAGTFAAAFAVLSRPAASPNSATERGLGQELSV